MSPPTDDLRDLVAAYALGAVEPHERGEIELAVEADATLQRELVDHLEVLARLAPEAEASPDLLDRILASLAHQDVPIDQPDDERGEATVISLDDARVSRTGQIARAVLAAVAAVALLLIGVGLVRNDRPDDLPGLAEQALEDPEADVVDLATVEGGEVIARAAVYPDGEGFLIADDLPTLAEGETYQLWMLPAGDAGPDAAPISLGLVPGDAQAAVFHLAAGSSGVALSREPAGGSVAPTTVVAVGPFA